MYIYIYIQTYIPTYLHTYLCVCVCLCLFLRVDYASRWQGMRDCKCFVDGVGWNSSSHFRFFYIRVCCIDVEEDSHTRVMYWC